MPPAAPYVPPAAPPPPPSPSPGGQTPGLRIYTLGAHGKATAQFTVGKESPSATFTTTHSGQATMTTALIAPSGDVIAASSPGKVFRSEQPHSDTYLVGQPDPGIWRVDVAVSSAPGLVSVRVAFTQGSKGNAAPLASATAALNERLLTVDAASSTDTDGTIVEYQWDFGDGAIASGSRSTHEYAGPGTYTITLVVKDDQGGLGFSTLNPVAVLK